MGEDHPITWPDGLSLFSRLHHLLTDQNRKDLFHSFVVTPFDAFARSEVR